MWPFENKEVNKLLIEIEECKNYEKRQQVAFVWLAHDFLEMCPEMKQVAIDGDSLARRYFGHSLIGSRPGLPTPPPPLANPSFEPSENYDETEDGTSGALVPRV